MWANVSYIVQCALSICLLFRKRKAVPTSGSQCRWCWLAHYAVKGPTRFLLLQLHIPVLVQLFKVLLSVEIVRDALTFCKQRTPRLRVRTSSRNTNNLTAQCVIQPYPSHSFIFQHFISRSWCRQSWRGANSILFWKGITHCRGGASSLDSLFAFPESLCSHFTKQIVRVTYLEICKVVWYRRNEYRVFNT